MASIDKKIGQARVGPGGMKCRCCGGDAHGKHKRGLLRRLKHTANRIIARETAADVRDLDEDFNWQQ